MFQKIWELWSDISTSTNKSGPGTLLKMCSRSWQYGRFQYHQKLLAPKSIYGLTKFRNWNLGHLGMWASDRKRYTGIGNVLQNSLVLRGTIQQNRSWKRSAEWLGSEGYHSAEQIPEKNSVGWLGKSRFFDRIDMVCQQIWIYRAIQQNVPRICSAEWYPSEPSQWAEHFQDPYNAS